MNLPSLDRYEDAVVPGGWIFADSSLIERKVKRTDVKAIYIPATRLASEHNMPKLANIILMGKIFKELNAFNEESIQATLKKIISARHADMLETNYQALKIGADFE